MTRRFLWALVPSIAVLAGAAGGEDPRPAIIERAIEYHGGDRYRRSDVGLRMCSKSGCSDLRARVDGGLFELEAVGQTSAGERRVRITNEAVERYRHHMKDDAILFFHISNRYLWLGPVLGRIAKEQNAYFAWQRKISPSKDVFAATCAIMTWDKDKYDILVNELNWQPIDMEKAAAFFARFGAIEKVTTPDGWGPGMDRVDMELNLAGED